MKNNSLFLLLTNSNFKVLKCRIPNWDFLLIYYLGALRVFFFLFYVANGKTCGIRYPISGYK